MKIMEGKVEPITEWTPHATRSKGLHLSKIIRDIMMTLEPSVFKPDMVNGGIVKFSRETQVKFEVGFVWEEMIQRSWLPAQGLSGELIQPGEQTLDGIHMTPDAFNIKEWAIEEWKATWRSMNKAATVELLYKNFWHWMVQIKAYCWAMETERARLRVLFLNGNYTYGLEGSGPQIRLWEIEWDPKELRDNWVMLIAHAKSKGWL